MKSLFVSLSLLFFIPAAAVAQGSKLNLGIQLNPIVHYNAARATPSSLGSMKPASAGLVIGTELNYHISTRWMLAPAFKYITRSQEVEQTEFFGYLDAESYVTKKFKYESFCFGALLKYRIKRLLPAAGILYALENHNSYKWQQHLYSDNPKTPQLQDLSWRFTPGDIGLKRTTCYLVLGCRASSPIGRLGSFEYGLTAYLPTRDMPVYTYEQSLATSDNGTLNTSVSYRSRQYSVELSLLYYAWNFNSRMKTVHLKKAKAAKAGS